MDIISRIEASAKIAAYREANRESIAASREAKRDKAGTRSAAYRAANPEKIAAMYAAYRATNPEKIAASRAAYYEANRDKVAARNAKRRARKLAAVPESFGEFDAFVIEVAHDEAKRRQGITGYEWHVDHIIPLAKGGLHCGTNIQVIPARLNLWKGDKLVLTTPGEWVRHIGGKIMRAEVRRVAAGS